MYIINKQRENDGYFHIHTLSCSVRPNSDFLTCDGTIDDAARVLGVSKTEVRKCKICMK